MPNLPPSLTSPRTLKLNAFESAAVLILNPEEASVLALEAYISLSSADADAMSLSAYLVSEFALGGLCRTTLIMLGLSAMKPPFAGSELRTTLPTLSLL